METKLPTYTRVLAALKELPFADRIQVFGSVARGEATRYSDVDVLLDVNEGRLPKDALAQLIALCKQFYGSLDVFVLTTAGVLYVRDDEAEGYTVAKHAKRILANAKKEGKYISQIA
jgi:predicted nucleotidyltransferase